MANIYTLSYVSSKNQKKYTVKVKAENFEEAKEKLQKALDFVWECYDKTVVTVEDWMLWDGWGMSIGCEQCILYGRKAQCWGKTTCHGFNFGCTCKKCSKKYVKKSKNAVFLKYGGQELKGMMEMKKVDLIIRIIQVVGAFAIIVMILLSPSSPFWLPGVFKLKNTLSSDRFAVITLRFFIGLLVFVAPMMYVAFGLLKLLIREIRIMRVEKGLKKQFEKLKIELNRKEQKVL